MFSSQPGKLGAVGRKTVIQRAIAVLRRYGQDAHIYLHGVGMLNGLTAANYLDSAGTTVGTVDQPVGLVLDAAGGLGVELVSNGDFNNGLTGWAQSTANYWTAVGGRAYHAQSASYNEITKTITTTNSPVWIEFDYECLTAANTAQFFYINGAGVVKTSDINGLPKLAAGVGRIRYFATDGCQKVGFSRYTAAEFYIDNISVREVTGIHASQPTTASKPILRRGALNLLTYSGDFGNAAWPTLNWVVSASDILSPSGDATGYKVAATATPNTLTRSQAATGTTQTFAVVFKPGTFGTPGFLIRNATTSTNLTASPAYVGNATGSDSFGAWEYSDYGLNGWKIARITCTSGIAVGNSLLLYFGATGAVASGQYLYVWRGMFADGQITAAQIQALGGIPLTTTAPASTALGPQYWSFDGSNDSLSLGGPLFQMADDHCVVAGAMCNAATGAAQIVASLSRDSSTGNSVARLQFDPSGTVSAAWTPTSGAAIITASGNLTGSVKVLAAHKVGDVKRLRVGGVTAGTNSTVQTDAGMNSAAISDYRVGLQLPFNGAIYPIIGIKGTVTDPDLLLLEKLVANLSGVTL